MRWKLLPPRIHPVKPAFTRSSYRALREARGKPVSGDQGKRRLRSVQFGIYYYPWYNKQRWAEAPRICTPTLGEYDSTDPAVVK